MSARNRLWMQSVGITSVVTVADGIEPVYPTTFAYMVIRLWDVPSANIYQHFPAALQFIRAAHDRGESVLVHWCVCSMRHRVSVPSARHSHSYSHQGISRSASVVLAYLIAYHKMTLGDAFAHVRAARPVICPNIGTRLPVARQGAIEA